MPDYSNGKIYTIRCKTDGSLIYVGSTVKLLCRRIAQHKYKSKKCPNRLLYKTINGNWNDWFIELYENYPCNNKEQLNKREGELIREIGTLNIDIPFRTNKEYQQENKEYYIQIKKNYVLNNPEKVLESKFKYYEKTKEFYLNKSKEKITCECGANICYGSLRYHKKTKKHQEHITKNTFEAS